MDYAEEYLKSNSGNLTILTETLVEYFSWRSNSLVQSLKEIKQPIICINSNRKSTNVEMARKYSDNFNVYIIEDVGHGVMVEKPDDFNYLLNNIINDLK